MSKTQRPQAFCLFCNGAGLTKEHLIADWIGEILPVQTEFQAQRRNVRRNDDGSASISSTSRKRQGATYKKVVRKFCVSCNGGWMSHLQNSNKTLIESLVTGDARSLKMPARRALATWATMTFIVNDASNDPSAIAQSDLRKFHNSQRALAGWQMWIGRMAGPLDVRFGHSSLAVKEGENPDLTSPNVQVATLKVGNLILHCSTQPPITPIAEYDIQVRRRFGLARFWPLGLKDIEFQNLKELPADGFRPLQFFHKDFSRFRKIIDFNVFSEHGQDRDGTRHGSMIKVPADRLR